MKREDLGSNTKEKILFEGISGVGKTYASLLIASIYAMAGKKVLIIDPQSGTDRDEERIFGLLTDEELDKITIVDAVDIKDYLKYMYGFKEEKKVGGKMYYDVHYLDYDLKICDGLTDEITLFKTKLMQKFKEKGYYEIGGKQFNIRDEDTFVLPYQFYSKLYDQIIEALVVMLQHDYDIISTMHPLRDTDAQQSLKQNIYQKFDSVIKFNKLVIGGMPKWDGEIVKNRGRDSPNKSNKLESIEVLLIYFIKKFNMDVEETMKKLPFLRSVDIESFGK